jgi:hypothetical protein
MQAAPSCSTSGKAILTNKYLKKFPLDDLRYYAHSNPTEEICGVCLKGRKFIQVENLAPDRTSSFLFSRTILEKYEDQVEAIFHTHVLEADGHCFSTHDVEVSRSLEIPYLLYSPVYDGWDYLDPMGIHPYPLEEFGSPDSPQYYNLWRFDYARADCATTVRAWYQGMLGIRLADYNRIDFDEAISHRLDQFGPGRWIENQFKILPKDTLIQDHDIIAIDLAGLNQANHLAVITSAENNMMLHNLGRERYSEQVCYNDSWRSRTVHIARHVSQF